VTAAIAARRYGQRAVELAQPAPSTELLELQGLYAFAAADTNGAKAAFARARDLSDEPHKWFGKGALAVVEYGRGAVEDAVHALERMVQEINAKDDPMAKWAAARLAEIGDHAEKEWLADSFDRTDLGAMWAPDLDAGLKPTVNGSRMVFVGKLTKGSSADRVDAVKKAKSFLAVGATMTLGPAHAQSGTTAGLVIEMQRGGSGGVDFQARLGIKDGRAALRILDGKEQGTDNDLQKWLDIPGLKPEGPHQLELRVVPRGDQQGKQLMLLASWNGTVVYRHELKMLNGNSSAPLKTQLFVSGNKNDPVDVAFDDYRLERRKEK
jgi:hypothetical protein